MASTSKDPKTETSDTEKKMTFEEKLDYLDHEIRLLHRFCLESGYNQRHITRSAEPFLSPVRKTKNRKLRRDLLALSVLVAIIGVVAYVEPVYRFSYAVGRIAAIKLLPIWDWTQIRDWDCLVDNPLYVDFQLTDDDCLVCKGLNSIERVSNLDNKDFIENFLKMEVPVVVEDGLRKWPENILAMNLSSLNELYKSHPVLQKYMPCNFYTNWDQKKINHRTFLHKAKALTQFFYSAHWENCFTAAYKAFREMFRRPYFLSMVVEIADSNWVFASKGNQHEETELPIPQSIIILFQIKGKMKIILRPRYPCEKKCRELKTTITEGEVMVITLADILWDKYYIPMGEGENIAMGIGGTSNTR